MKETPQTVESYTGLSQASVRRHIIAVIEERGSKKSYSQDMILNGLTIPVYERIAERSKDEGAKSNAIARINALKSDEPVAQKTSESVPFELQTTFTNPSECNALNLSETIESALSELHEVVAANPAHEISETVAVKSERESLAIRAMNFTDSYMLSVINAIDIILIFIGLWRLYGVPGIALAFMGSLFLIKAQIIARNVALRQSNHNAIEVVKWMCLTSFFLHCITFWNANQMQWISMDGTGVDLLNNSVKVLSAIGPAAFVSILAFKAVETEYKITKEKQ